MTAIWGHLTGVLIIVMMAVFIGIWAWAWLPRHRRTFGRLARLPMEDDDAAPGRAIPATRAEDRK